MQDSDNNYSLGIYTSEEHDVLVYSILNILLVTSKQLSKKYLSLPTFL